MAYAKPGIIHIFISAVAGTQKRHIFSRIYDELNTKQTQFHVKLLFVNNKQQNTSKQGCQTINENMEGDTYYGKQKLQCGK